MSLSLTMKICNCAICDKQLSSESLHPANRPHWAPSNIKGHNRPLCHEHRLQVPPDILTPAQRERLERIAA